MKSSKEAASTVTKPRRKFREATYLNPGSSSAWRGLGLAYQRMGLNPEARAAFERYLRLAPHAPDSDRIRERLTGL